MPTRLYFGSASSDAGIGKGICFINPDENDPETFNVWWRTLELRTSTGSALTTIVTPTKLGPLTFPIELKVTNSVHYEWYSPPIEYIYSDNFYGVTGELVNVSYPRISAANGDCSKILTLAYDYVDPNTNPSGAVILTTGSSMPMQYNIWDRTVKIIPFARTLSTSLFSPYYPIDAVLSKNDNVMLSVGNYDHTYDAELEQQAVYHHTGENYEILKCITSSTAIPSIRSDYRFGKSIACSADASKIFISEDKYPSASIPEVGIVHFYTGSDLSIVKVITGSFPGFPSQSVSSSFFGYSIDCSDSGDVLAVSAFGASGSLGRIFIYTGSNYDLVRTITSSQIAGDQTLSFGKRIKLSSDGTTLVVSNPYKNFGEVYVYTGSNWTTRRILTASATASGATQPEWFGEWIDCSYDGKTIVVGSPRAEIFDSSTSTLQLFSGRIHIFTGSNWSSATMLTSSIATPQAGTYYGERFVFSRQTKDEIHSEGTYVFDSKFKNGVLFRDIQFNICANQSANGANSVIGVSVDAIDPSLGAITNIMYGLSNFGTELGNTNAKRTWSTSIPPTRLGRGYRIRVQLGIADAPGVNMGSTQTVTFTFNGSTATSDSNIFFSESITFMTSSNTPYTMYMTDYYDESYPYFIEAPTSINYAKNPGDSDIRYITGANSHSLVNDTASAIIQQFGYSLATSNDSDVLLVGAPLASALSGAAYIFTSSYFLQPSDMVLAKQLRASDSQSRHRDLFGHSVDISNDKSTAVIGAPNAIAQNISGSGKVYVYSGSNWTIERILTSSNLIVSGNFGHKVACSGDGNIIAITAPNERNLTTTGSVYIISGSNRNVIVKLTGSATGSTGYGASVAISLDGTTVVVGSPSESVTYDLIDEGGPYTSSSLDGKVYIYTGSNWSETYIVTSSQEYSGYLAPESVLFGTDVACSYDGKIIAAGAPGLYTPGIIGGYSLFFGDLWTTSSYELGYSSYALNNGERQNKMGNRIALSGDGKRLYAAGLDSTTVLAYDIDYESGNLINNLKLGISQESFERPGFYNPEGFNPEDTSYGADLACGSSSFSPYYIGRPQTITNAIPDIFEMVRKTFPRSPNAIYRLLSASRGTG